MKKRQRYSNRLIKLYIPPEFQTLTFQAPSKERSIVDLLENRNLRYNVTFSFYFIVASYYFPHLDQPLLRITCPTERTSNLKIKRYDHFLVVR